jgi:hypothetical protein
MVPAGATPSTGAFARDVLAVAFPDFFGLFLATVFVVAAFLRPTIFVPLPFVFFLAINASLFRFR